MAILEVKVPDIGDFADVPVITVMVAPGDTVAPEDPLIELESDKATLEVPSPVAGKVVEVKVSEGDRVSEGALILTVEAEGAPAEAAPAVSEGGTPATSEPAGYGSAAGVHETIEIKVPDIGDFSDVPVITVMVAPGDKVAADSRMVANPEPRFKKPLPEIGAKIGCSI